MSEAPNFNIPCIEVIIIIHTSLNGNCAKAATSSIYALNKRKEARAADPIANPFVVAFVVLPTASRMSVISLTLSGCRI
jgi:hypothetical protein